MSWTYNILAKSQGLVMRLTVLTRISRSHGKAQNPHGKLTLLAGFFFSTP